MDMDIAVEPAEARVNVGEAESLKLVCRSIRQESRNAKTYVFGTEGDVRVLFRAGQFLNITFGVNGQEAVRSYSISSSASHGARLAITVKRIPNGTVSNWLFDNLRVGDRVRAEGPLGAFTDEEIEGPLVFLSAGSGVTPVAAMMRTYVDRCDDRDVVFLHFSRSPEDTIFAADFSAWARALPRARIIVVATNPSFGSGWVGPTGRISQGLVSALIPDIAGRTVFACGPEGFMQTAREIAERMGVPADRFFQESFVTFVTKVAEEADEGPSEKAYEVRFAKSGSTTACSETKSILKAAQAINVKIQTSCGKGICGTCRVKLTSGTVTMTHGGGIKQREIDQGYILACCSKPTSDLVVDR